LFRVLAALFVLSNVLLPVSCQTGAAGNKAAEQPVWNGVPGVFKAAVVGVLKPGEPFVVAAAGKGIPEGSAGMRAVLVKGDKVLNRGAFFSYDAVSSRGPVSAAIMAVPTTVEAGQALIRVEAGGKVLQTIDLTIEARTFASESFAITGAMTDILTKPDPEKTRQAERMWAIWAKTGSDIFTTGNFVMPVVSNYQTSIFGTRRVYKYPDGRSSSSIHAGVDWRAPTGTPITAPAPGRVALAMNRITTGNTIVIEHMPGVYSLYYHMDKLAVAEGDMVQTGTRLGDAGATGFATGAHLHYEIRVATENTDPATFQGRTILDKDAILTILNE
jgi:murein DD-endopeptidase MepM/ murein hydrolase activator NlpD